MLKNGDRVEDVDSGQAGTVSDSPFFPCAKNQVYVQWDVPRDGHNGPIVRETMLRRSLHKLKRR